MRDRAEAERTHSSGNGAGIREQGREPEESEVSLIYAVILF